MSSVPSQLWQAICKHLFPTVTYHHNSGGEPEHIPDLSYDELVAFYRTHYHPSNAIFMTFGDIPAADHQANFETLALQEFTPLDREISVPNEQRYPKPIHVKEFYPYTPESSPEEADNKHHVVLGWLLGTSTDLESVFEAQLLNNVLLDNSASPLLHALETSKLGNSPSPLCGLEDSMKELVFVCGLEGCHADAVADVEQLVQQTLESVARDGVPFEQLDAMLNQLELQQREVSGDSYPYGLQLLLTALGSATHRGDPIALLDMEPAIAAVREKIKDPDYIKSLTRRFLLDNDHRVTLHMAPDLELAEKRLRAEQDRLAEIKTGLDDNAKQAIIEQAKALSERQEAVEDESILPKVGLDDIADAPEDIPFETSTTAQLPTTRYNRGTNGLIYQQLITRIPQLPETLLPLLPYYTSALTEVGVGDLDYRETQVRQASVCGSINAFSTYRSPVEDVQGILGYSIISSKALQRFHREQSQLMRDTLDHARFDELDRLGELLAQQRAHAENSISGNGHAYAMQAASSGFCPLANLNHKLSGLAGLQALKRRHDNVQDPAALRDYATQLQESHGFFQAAEKQLLVIAEADSQQQIQQANDEIWQECAPGSTAPLALPSLHQNVQQCWITAADVNFCAKAYATVPLHHPDAAALTVLGGFLRNGFLHRAIREQGGAYGGGASQDSTIAAFRFYSYRDPRTLGTLDDFDRSIEWLLGSQHSEEQLEQAVLGVVGSLDKPGSPAGEAKRDFQNRLFGRSKQLRDEFRQRLIQVSIADLQRVASNYLTPDKANVAVLTNQNRFDQDKAFYEKRGAEIFKI